MKFWPLVILLLSAPLVELYVLIKVGGVVGAGWAVALVISTAVIGLALVRIQGFSVLSRISQTVARGEIPALPMLEGVSLFVAGAFLLLPGFLTDMLGFMLLVPPIRRGLIRFSIAYFVVIHPFPGDRRASSREAGGAVLEGESQRLDRDNN